MSAFSLSRTLDHDLQMPTLAASFSLMLINDASFGIRDDYNAVVVTTKCPVPSV